jgi:hypothetical protein
MWMASPPSDVLCVLLALLLQDLKAWTRPTHNIASVLVMAGVCFRPIMTLFVFLLWRSVVALRRLLRHVGAA